LSLGCPKNLVDSESLLKSLKEEGIYYSSDPEDSDILMINTCGFIDDAKKESIEEILNLVNFKSEHKDKKLIVFGCFSGRYGYELKKEIPEIDAILGVGDERKIVEYCKKLTESSRQNAVKSMKNLPSSFPLLSATSSYAYLKIAEGCDRNCSYCVIPSVRGKFRSMNPENILNEAEEKIKSGMKELILVAQDITAYGLEFNGYNLSRLVKDIASIQGDFWIRLLYLYPTSLNDELLETISNEKKVCKYIDLPIQHSENKILKLMRRGGSREYFVKTITRMRDIIPDVNIRTTLIVGFPQETDSDFDEMVKFVRSMQFDKLGVFTYSREDGTPSYNMRGQVMKSVKSERYNKIMEIQSAISLEKNKHMIGRTFRALVDEVNNDVTIARLDSQAPDIDGVVLIHDNNVEEGSFMSVRIEDVYDYDLKGVFIR
jgi:ribosomal protein S12 methylthiotransferase